MEALSHVQIQDNSPELLHGALERPVNKTNQDAEAAVHKMNRIE
jgi:hypothetical protein